MALVDEVVAVTEPEEVDDHERQHRQPRDGQIQLTMQQSRVPTMTMTTVFFFQLRSLKALTCSDHLNANEEETPAGEAP